MDSGSQVGPGGGWKTLFLHWKRQTWEGQKALEAHAPYRCVQVHPPIDEGQESGEDLRVEPYDKTLQAFDATEGFHRRGGGLFRGTPAEEIN